MLSLVKIRTIFERKDPSSNSSELNDDVLCINCRGCRRVPDIGSKDCIRCITININEQGNAGRIRLRTSRDLEIHGTAAEIICELAMISRSSVPYSSAFERRSCSECNNSCNRIMDILWSGFPDPNFESARGRLAGFFPSSGECNACVQRTYRALDQVELGMERLRKRMSIESARKGGV